MSISSAFTYENFPEAHRQGFSCFSPRVVCSSQLKRMIEVLNVGMLKNTLFLALTVANVIFFFVLKFMASLTSSPPQIIKTKSEFVCHPKSIGCCFV